MGLPLLFPQLLDELVMSSEDLPPPPPHLVALSQELGLEEQVRESSSCIPAFPPELSGLRGN